MPLCEDERLLIVGVGTGLEYLPAGVWGAGVGPSDGMLESARGRLEPLTMDARALDFPDASFEAVYLPLILAIVEDGARVLGKAARVVVPEAVVSACRVR